MDGHHGGPARLPAPARGPGKAKRDEWTDGGVLCLLEVYESKWLLRNRAKLKWSDWEDIAHQVFVRCSGTKKTPNQCKNKVESMKKRYRTEMASTARGAALSSSWRFYAQMDGLLRGSMDSLARPGRVCDIDLQALPVMEADVEVAAQSQDCDGDKDNSSNTLPDEAQGNANSGAGLGENEKNENRHVNGDVDASSPASKVAGEQVETETNSYRLKKRKGSQQNHVAESIRLLADSMLKIEQARIKMYKDSERARAEAEIRRTEMELKRTEIVANTQLQIAKLFVKRLKGESNRNESSSANAKLNIPQRKERMGD